VKIVAPIVFSLLNVLETIMAHYQSMDGGYSFALSPYFNENLTYHLLDEELISPVLEIEDMWCKPVPVYKHITPFLLNIDSFPSKVRGSASAADCGDW
jgi:PhoPQ-activated pathogenicity-related protein